MIELLQDVQKLIASGERSITMHAHKRLAEHNVTLAAALEGVFEAVVVEVYPQYYAGPALLCLQRDQEGEPIHALWGIPKSGEQRAYLITVYRPDPLEWLEGFSMRRPKP